MAVTKELWTAKVIQSSIDGSIAIVGEIEEEKENRSYTVEDSTTSKQPVLFRCAASTNSSSANANADGAAAVSYNNIGNAMIASNHNYTKFATVKVASYTSKAGKLSRSSSPTGGRGRR